MPDPLNVPGASSEFSRNLREAVSRVSSVAEFCRRTGFNRQQFNKYLAGVHVPSRHSLAKIASCCGLMPEDFSLSTAEFHKKLHRQSEPAEADALNAHFQTMAGLARGSAPQLKPLLGSYFRYHRSSIYAGSVLRALTVLYPDDDLVRYVTLESITLTESHGQERYRFAYRGVCYFLGNRVFMCDYERRQFNEMTATILMPQFRSPTNYMFGIVSGVAATPYRQPFSTQVAFQKVNDVPTVQRGLLRRAGLLSPDDASIPTAVRSYLRDASVLIAAA